ncbi:MAG: sprT domain-containing protein [Flavobacteriaceae bacterium]|nr:sprT domain-containing protein [Flavobacteriaceae bacterium]|tara:strand:+ start:136 stop:738 length:603 start_codon:yes stop_codon:yes gene_type:complete
MILMSFIPVNAKENVRDLINKHKLNIIIVSERKTKRGDFRVYSNGFKKITINQDSNKFRFLITLLHEISHQLVYQKFGNNIKPHGIEWKKKFKEISEPFLFETIFPLSILDAFKTYLKNPKSSTDLDKELTISLTKFDTLEDYFFIDQLEMGQLFMHRRKEIFKKISKKRKRYVCEKISNGKLYLFQPNTLILDYKNEKR